MKIDLNYTDMSMQVKFDNTKEMDDFRILLQSLKTYASVLQSVDASELSLENLIKHFTTKQKEGSTEAV